MKATMVYMEWN